MAITSLEKAKKIAKVLDDKKAVGITVLHVAEGSSLWEYFVIATGTSNTHIKALSNEVEEKLEQIEERPLHIEGYISAEWILMDYNDVNVHLFKEDSRMFYSLERLWQDAEIVEWND